MALSINQIFENRSELVKEDRNWGPVTTTLQRFVEEIRSFLGDETFSDTDGWKRSKRNMGRIPGSGPTRKPLCV